MDEQMCLFSNSSEGQDIPTSRRSRRALLGKFGAITVAALFPAKAMARKTETPEQVLDSCTDWFPDTFCSCTYNLGYSHYKRICCNSVSGCYDQYSTPLDLPVCTDEPCP